MILSAVLMLRYLGLFDEAAAIEHAVFVTLESGVLTGDVVGYDRGTSDHRLHRRDHRQPRQAHRDAGRSARPRRSSCPSSTPRPTTCGRRRAAVVGLDVFVESPLSAAELGASLMELTHDTKLSLEDDQLARHEGVPADGRDHRDRRPLPVPVHHQAEPRRPARRGRARAARSGSRRRTAGCTSRSSRSSTGSSGSPATRARTERCRSSGAVVMTCVVGGGSGGRRSARRHLPDGDAAGVDPLDARARPPST